MLHFVSAELRVPETEWPTTVPAFQSIINNSSSRRLGGRCPITVHTDVESGNLLAVALTIVSEHGEVSLHEARIMQSLNIS